MPRVKPTKKLDVIGKIDLLPEKAVGEYFASKQHERFIIKEPNWDSPGDAVEQLFIHNEIEYQQMLELQRQMLANQKRNASKNRERIHRVQLEQRQLRKHFIDANTFMRECDEKREVAAKSVADQIAKQAALMRKYHEYKHLIKELTEFEKTLGAVVDQFEPYERVLNAVVERSEIFDSVSDCMQRCDALMLAQTEIFRMDQDKYMEIEEMRRNMLKVTDEAALRVLGLKNELVALNRLYNEAYSMCHKWERILENAQNCVGHNDLDKERTLDTIHHLYRLLCRRLGISFSLQRHQCKKSLDFIREEVLTLHEIVAECSDKNSDSRKKRQENC